MAYGICNHIPHIAITTVACASAGSSARTHGRKRGSAATKSGIAAPRRIKQVGSSVEWHQLAVAGLSPLPVQCREVSSSS